MTKRSTEFELAAKEIYQQLEPECQIEHDQSLKGRHSGINRQIDVTIRKNIAGHELLIIVQCKDENKKLDVNKVGEFSAVMNDVGAHRGVLIAKKGFSKSALQLAKRSGIDCCLLHHAKYKDWTQELKIPIIFEDIHASISWNLKVFLEKGSRIDFDPKRFKVSNIKIHDEFVQRWNSGKVDYQSGIHQLDLGIKEPWIQSEDGDIIKCDKFVLEYAISKTFRLAYVEDLPSSKGIRNLSTDSTSLTFSSKDLQSFPISHQSETIYHRIEDIPLKSAQHIQVLVRPQLDERMLTNNRVWVQKTSY